MGIIFARRSARIRTCCVGGNPSALVFPAVKHFLLQTLSSDLISHRRVLLTISMVLLQLSDQEKADEFVVVNSKITKTYTDNKRSCATE